MPELPDVEGYRRIFAAHAAGKRVTGVRWVDTSMLRDATPRLLTRALRDKRFGGPQRQGKLLICPADGATLLLHFGMTGKLVFSENGARHRHDRLALDLEDGRLHYRNMRKFGGIWLARSDPELERIRGRLGPDWLSVSAAQFDRMVERKRASTKAALMDQSMAAGLGNLTADEALWQARVDPVRPAASLTPAERRRLYRKIQQVLRDSIPYGLVPAKAAWLTGARNRRDAACPRCGGRLERRKVAGRTTVFCPREQR